MQPPRPEPWKTTPPTAGYQELRHYDEISRQKMYSWRGCLLIMAITILFVVTVGCVAAEALIHEFHPLNTSSTTLHP